MIVHLLPAKNPHVVLPLSCPCPRHNNHCAVKPTTTQSASALATFPHKCYQGSGFLTPAHTSTHTQLSLCCAQHPIAGSMQALRGTPCSQRCSTSLSGSRQLVVRAPVAFSRRSGHRTAVVVEANLFSRAVRVIQSYANQIGECLCPGARWVRCQAVVDTLASQEHCCCCTPQSAKLRTQRSCWTRS